MFLSKERETLLFLIMGKGFEPLSHALEAMTGLCPKPTQPSLITAGLLASQLSDQHGVPILSGAGMDFSGPISGRAVLYCAPSDYQPIARLMMQPKELFCYTGSCLIEDAYQELASIVLNALLIGLAGMFGSELKTRPPKAFFGNSLGLLGGIRNQADKRPLIHWQLHLDEGGNRYPLGMVLDMVSFQSLTICLDDHLARHSGGQLLTA